MRKTGLTYLDKKNSMKSKVKERKMRYISIFLVFIFFISGITKKMPGQVNLGEIKKKEEERRKQTEKSKAVINDSNLKEAQGSGKPHTFNQFPKNSASPSKDGGKASSGIKLSPEQTQVQSTIPRVQEDMEKQKELWWRGQYHFYADKVKSLEERLEKEEDKLQNNGVPLLQPRGVFIPTTDQKSLVESLKKQLEKAKSDLEALEERARKEGIPPGWLRE